MKEVMIIGGGASGMMAAIVAARAGCQVCIVERLPRMGKKILVTGNGRCNISNIDIAPQYYHSSSKMPLDHVLGRFGYKEMEQFFKELGIIPLVEGKKVYPLSEQASSVVDVLRMEIERLEIEVIVDTPICELKPIKRGWQLRSETGACFEAQKVILATGGMTSASLGCDGLGYKLAKRMGHTIQPTFPILVHLLSDSPYCKMMKGTKLKGNVRIWVNEECKRMEEGEVLFTEDGLSGPPIFQLSRSASWATLNHQKAKITIDLLPHMSLDELVSLLYERITMQATRTIEQLLIGMVHKRAIVPLLKASRIDSMHRGVDLLEYEEVLRLAETMKSIGFDIQGTRGYKFAQVTAGGITVDEINLETMASVQAENLYITGEVMDVDGDCGGYNLQWAWATGYIAGLSVSRKEDRHD